MTFDFKCTVLLLVMLMYSSECALRQNLVPSKKDISTKDNSHWCCKVETPLIFTEKTKITSYSSIQSGKHKCGYQSCGFLGWGSCTRWCMNYWTLTSYHTESYTVSEQTQCPQNQITCCNNHLLVAGHCYELSEVIGNVDLLNQLNREGVIVPAGK